MDLPALGQPDKGQAAERGDKDAAGDGEDGPRPDLEGAGEDGVVDDRTEDLPRQRGQDGEGGEDAAGVVLGGEGERQGLEGGAAADAEGGNGGADDETDRRPGEEDEAVANEVGEEGAAGEDEIEVFANGSRQ
jgi:hypothetical protein